MKQINVPQSGSQADTTASRNRFGQYTRNRRAPVNVNSAAQQTARQNLQFASKRWKSLTDIQRTSWGSYAGGRTFTDSLGQTVTLTGFQAYVGFICTAKVCDLTVTDDVPADGSVSIGNIGLTSLTPTEMEVQFSDINPSPITKVQVFGSAPASAGRAFQNDYRLIGVLSSVTVAAPIDVMDIYGQKFGKVTEGQKVWLKFIPVLGTGVVGAPVFVSGVVAAD